jgi:hypothetical protein
MPTSKPIPCEQADASSRIDKAEALNRFRLKRRVVFCAISILP